MNQITLIIVYISEVWENVITPSFKRSPLGAGHFETGFYSMVQLTVIYIHCLGQTLF